MNSYSITVSNFPKINHFLKDFELFFKGKIIDICSDNLQYLKEISITLKIISLRQACQNFEIQSKRETLFSKFISE